MSKLALQQQAWRLFGFAGVLLGLINQPTLDFFLVHFFPDEPCAVTYLKNLSFVDRSPGVVPDLDAKVTLTQANATRMQAFEAVKVL